MGVDSVGQIIGQKAICLYLNFEKENPITEWIVFEFWIKNKRVEASSACECVWLV